MHKIHNVGSELWSKTIITAIVKQLRTAISERGHASLVVPGGRTARQILPQLANVDLPWKTVTITLTDERWVPVDHVDSNEHLVHKTLIEATGATFISLKTDDASPNVAGPTVATRIEKIPSPFDVVFIGMGDDGHFASLFPQCDHGQKGQLVCFVDRPDYARISLTANHLLNSRLIVLPISGPEKRAVLEKAIVAGSTKEYPVRHVLHQDQTPVLIITD